MREEALAIAGAQVLDSSGYEQSDLEEIEFLSEILQVDLNAVCRPGIGTPFHQQPP